MMLNNGFLPDTKSVPPNRWLTDGRFPSRAQFFELEDNERQSAVFKRALDGDIPSAGTDPKYQRYFEAFLKHTNEKEVFARAVLTIKDSIDRASAPEAKPPAVLLDLGAGNGGLTAKLAPYFDTTFAIDKDLGFVERLGEISKVRAVWARMESLPSFPEYQIALFSHSLSGLPAGETAEFLGRLFRNKHRDGKVVLITGVDGCAWDCFLSEVRGRLDTPGTGGHHKLEAQIRASGYETKLLQKLKTDIVAGDIDGLARCLAFFFIPKAEEYLSRLEEFKPLLEKFAVPVSTGAGYSLEVRHVVAEITRMKAVDSIFSCADSVSN